MTNNFDYLRKPGHFVLASGRHSLEKVECDRVLDNPESRREIAECLGNLLLREVFGMKMSVPKVVVGVPNGCIKLAHDLDNFNKENSIPSVFVESFKDDQGKIQVNIDELHKIECGIAVVVEDVFTTGESTKQVIDILDHHGIGTLAAAAIWNRGNKKYISRIAVHSLTNKELPMYAPSDCPQFPDCLDMNFKL